MNIRAIRGAIQLGQDSAQEMAECVAELLEHLMLKNGLKPEDLISILFTATPDLHSDFPASGARKFGLTQVALMCAQEIDVSDAMPRVVRVLVTCRSDSAEVHHIYLRGTQKLRQDLAP